MVEVKEVLRQWLAGTAKKRIAARLGLDVKTVRRYIEAAQKHGLTGDGGEAGLSDELLATVLVARRGAPGRPRGDSWALCEVHRERIAAMLRQGLRLSKLLAAPVEAAGCACRSRWLSLSKPTVHSSVRSTSVGPTGKRPRAWP